MKNFTSLIKETFHIYKLKLKPILLLVFLEIILGAMIILVIFGSIFSALMLKGQTSSLAIIIQKILTYFFLFFPFLFIFCSLYLLVASLVLVMKPVGVSLKEVFKEAWKNYWNYLIIGVLVSIFVSLGFVFLIIPGLILSIYLSFSLYVYIDEKRKGMEAIKRSWNLVKGNWWQVFGRRLMLIILTIIIAIGINALGKNYSGPFLNLLGSFIGLLVQTFGSFFSMIYIYLIYLDLKKSKEIQTAVPSIEEKVSI
ncbi:MAG: hypothetical protein PHH35_01850 [Candidatus Pacebacteria bacterium]|jgi:hypothetical protein|nr:hypothetical protein [Candidatus Paceibacterota bacterium]